MIFSLCTSQFWNPVAGQFGEFGGPDWAREPPVDNHQKTPKTRSFKDWEIKDLRIKNNGTDLAHEPPVDDHLNH